MTVRKAEFGFGGDALPASQPQYQNDHNYDQVVHDEPDYEPGSAEYNFFYGNGQLHVSPHHGHDELMGHSGVRGDHRGPMATGHITVERGRATWHTEGNVALRGMARVFKDYTKQVGWRWGGLTDLDGEPVDDSFAPKKSMQIRDNETGARIDFALQGKTALVGKINAEQRAAIEAQGFKIAEYPGGTNMNDRLKVSPMGEDLQQYNISDPQPNKNTTLPDDRQPAGTFKCPHCGQIFPNWSVYMRHRRDEEPMGDELPVEDGKFPETDMDEVLPARFHENPMRIMPLASINEARRYEDFNDNERWLALDRPTATHYGAYRNGFVVGVATVASGGEVLYLGGSAEAKRSLIAALQVHYDALESADRLPGFVHTSSGSHWAAGTHPKDMIDSAVPFVYDVHEDRIAIGHPGERTSDIPGEFTPGGIVEGVYEPGGKVILHTMTNVPYTVRHLVDLWYWSLPHMEVTGVELHDAAGGKTKLAKVSKTDVGSYIKTLTATDPAAWGAYQALRKAGGQVYVVGGAVRDALLQKEPKDIDLLVTGVPAEMVAHTLENLPGRTDLTGKDFGVYRYRTKGQDVEIALPRTERSTGDRRVDFDVQVDHDLPIEDDLLRRDFTVNAMAVDLDTGRLVDPYGGAKDIEDRRLTTVHPSSFEEDPTRLVRALVASSRHSLSPDESTRHEMESNAHRLGNEARERIQAELDKLFRSARPADAIRLAHDTGILRYLFPEVANNFDFDQNNPHHNFKLGDHLLHVLENVSSQTDDPDLRLAALLHDIGKPASAWTNPETGYNHYYKGPGGEGDQHEHVGAEHAEQRLRSLKYPVARINRIKHLITHHMFPAFSSPKGARKFLHKVGDEHADDLLTLRWADQRGKGQSPAELAARTSVDQQRGLVEQVRSAQQPTNQSALAINGNDIIALGVPAGPDIGRILRHLTDDVIEDPKLNDKDLLTQRAQEYVNAA